VQKYKKQRKGEKQRFFLFRNERIFDGFTELL